MSRIVRCIVSLGLCFSAACTSLGPLLASLTPPSPVPTRGATATPMPPLATETPSIQHDDASLRIWLPEQFNPAAESRAAELVAERLEEFQAKHSELEIEIRIKKVDEEGVILNALSVTSVAAPGALPDLVLLSRPDLEAAAVQGLLHPMEGLSTLLDDPNWYGYAQQLGYIHDTGYGLPFLGDTLVLVYYPELGQIATWEEVLASEGQIVFPAGNPQGLVGLALYASAGGQILNEQGVPTLEREALTRVLSFVQEGVSQEIMPTSLANVTNEMQTLQIYRTGNANKGIIWYLSYEPAEDGALAPLPGLDQVPFSYATGWVWALAGADPENQQLAVELAEYLVDDNFLAQLTSETGYLPTRPSTVETSDRTMTAILESAHPLPSNDVLVALGPLMQEALTRVLNGEPPEEVVGSILETFR